MKKRFFTMIAVCLAMSVAVAFAQAPQGQERHRGPGQGRGQGPQGSFDPATMVQHHVDRLAQLLSLTDQQKAQATTIFTNAQQASQPLHQQLRDARKSLQDAVKTNNTAQIDQYATLIGSLTGQLLSIESKAHAQFTAILTDEQKAKLPDRGFGAMGMGGGVPGGRPMGEFRGRRGPNQ